MIFGWMVESMGGWQAAFWTLAPGECHWSWDGLDSQGTLMRGDEVNDLERFHENTDSKASVWWPYKKD
jgi:hypothetical protein